MGLAMFKRSIAVTAARRVSGDQEQERTASAIASHRFLAAKSALACTLQYNRHDTRDSAVQGGVVQYRLIKQKIRRTFQKHEHGWAVHLRLLALTSALAINNSLHNSMQPKPA